MPTNHAGQNNRSLLTVVFVATLVVLVSGCAGSTSPPAPTVVKNESYELSGGSSFSATVNDGVLANDSGNDLVLSLLTAPMQAEANGFELGEAGEFSYLANVTEITQDSFSYSVTGADGVTLIGTTGLTIYPAPKTVAEAYSISPGEALDVGHAEGVLSNDTLYKQPYVLEVLTEPTKAESFVLNEDGSFEYKSRASGSGVDSFTYRVTDALGASAEQEVQITLYNEALAGADDSFSVQGGELLERSGQAGIFANDEGALFASAELVKLPEKAIDFELREDGGLVYRTVETSGTDSFSYLVKSADQQQGPFTVTLNIEAPAGDPTQWDSCSAFDMNSTSTVTGQLAAPGITDATFELVTEPRLGMLSSFDTSGSFIYERTEDARGQDSFSYKIYDASGAYVGDATQELIGTPFRIMPVGDSITAGVQYYNGTSDTPGSDQRQGYRKYLKDQLESDGYPVDFVGSKSDGWAIPGFTDTEHNGNPGVNSLYVAEGNRDGGGMAQWITETPADAVLLHIGTNDVHYSYDSNRILNNVNTTLDAIKSAGEVRGEPVAVMHAKLIPRTDDPTRAQRIDLLNPLYVDLVSERKNQGDRIFLVDQNTAFGGTGDPHGYLGADHLHPQLSGYEVMATEWATRLIETGVLKKCP